MNLARRTIFQVAFLIMALIIWGYGHRVDDPTIRLVGIAFFAVSFVLRFFRGSETKLRHDDPSDEATDGP